MVEIIGLVTMGALVRLLAWSLAGESDAERRRVASVSCYVRLSPVAEKATPIRQAA
jgi:hypothetical protein